MSTHKQHHSLRGSCVAIVTPMNSEGAIDWAALEQLVEWHIAEGTQSIAAVGTTGESPTLNEVEKRDIVQRILKLARGRINVIAGSGSNATSEAIKSTVRVAELGCQASLQIVPYYNKPTQEGLYQHFKAIAEAVNLPIILYNVPSRTVVDLDAETVARLAQLSNIIGIKEATGSIKRSQQIRKLCGPDFLILSGDDSSAVRLMIEAEADGIISVASNLIPQKIRQLCDLALSGKPKLQRQAVQLDATLQPLYETIFCEANPIPIKWALHTLGFIPSGIRLPLLPLSHKHRDSFKEILDLYGLIDKN